MENKILVTGATGNIGKEIVSLLKAQKANFIAATSSGATIEGVETVQLDFADKASIENALEGITTLFMLLPSHPEIVKWGANIIDAAKKCGVNHIVRSSGSFANSNSDLLIEKLLGTTDKNLKESGLNFTITAPSSFMQNFITTLAADYKSGTIYQATGNEKISWVDVRDIAAVNVKVLLNPEQYLNQTLILTGSESFSYQDAINRMNHILGKDTKCIDIPNEVAIKEMEKLHFPQFIIDLLASLNESVSQGHFVENTDTIKNIIGTEPISFKQFITDNKTVWL